MRSRSFFLTVSALTGQGTLYYTINLGTFVDASRDDFRPLQSVGFLYAYKMENNFSQIYLGAMIPNKQRSRR